LPEPRKENEGSRGVRIDGAGEVIRGDLEAICVAAGDELLAMEGKRVLITGGAGFLGYYLVQAPLHWNRHHRRGAPIEVTVLDNFVRGIPDWLGALRSDDLTVVKHDITRPLPSGLAPDFVVHAASIASPTYYRKYPIETMDANVNGLRLLLDDAVRRGGSGAPVDGFLFFSTSEIYGDPDPGNIPTDETYRGFVSCTGPRACYDESKRYGETLAVNFARVHGVPVTIARPFNNFGPGLKISDGRVIPDFARDVLEGRDIVMLSDGSPTRTYCYVSDAVAGYFKVLVRGTPGEAYNIGTESPEISIRDLADRIVSIAGDLFGYGGRVVHRSSADAEYLTDNPNRRCPRIGKARSGLGYEPTVSLDEGLQRSLLWYAAHREAEDA
jgi:UDP-glucuronate decarboxylase